MSATTSPGIGKRYGVQRVCAAWGMPRSSYYAARTESPDPEEPPQRRGPRTEISDDALLAMIREDLESSPFQGEGYRKVWARLHFVKGLRVSRKRVLRLMRQAKLLSPYRTRRGEGKTHEGTITTDAPNVMWGTDGAKVFTVQDGWVWIFTAVEHWNAECVGHHVCKVGSRFNALEPIAMGVTRIYGSVAAGVARGLRLRMDHGQQYLSDHFQNQLKFWGIVPSFAFVEEPQTNGVAERFNRTLKEQAIYGRVFQTIEEVREAVGAFIQRYNEQWRVEKIAFLTPRQAREQWSGREAA